ncbi:MAG: RNHCP domain-containing protein [Spirochaetaceae bacterium]
MSRDVVRIRHASESFVCVHCGRTIAPAESGTSNRNHCPYCLRSRHVDLKSGDRRSGCRAVMEPIGIWVQANGEWSILHRCERCGFIRSNRIAGDDNEAMLLGIAARPLSRLPFPLESLMRKTYE